MNTRAFAVTILAALLTVTLASSASAECAWVLWVDFVWESGQRHRPLAPFATFDTKLDCEARLVVVVYQARNTPNTTVEKLGDQTAIFEWDSQGERVKSSSWICLPDTVDPRGAKGK